MYIQGAAFNVTYFESRITHLLYTAINATEHGQVSQCLGFTKRLTSSMQCLGDVLHDNQGNACHLPGTLATTRRRVSCVTFAIS